jgi:cobalt/nickel transport system permease protein
LRAGLDPVPFHLPFDSYRTPRQEAVVHVPDGFIDAPVSLGAGVVAAAAIGLALRGSRRELGDERVAPLAGLVAAFVFAVQMLNFPVAAGTSGHLLGGALAAVLVGPWTGLLCVSVVLLVQLFFADGGLTAYGVNVTCMAVTTALVGWLVFRALLRVLPTATRSVVPASFGAALVSVPAAALVFTGCYALGGTTDVPLGSLATAMIGVHVLIGLGEAVITALVVSSVLAVRPDLVYGARELVGARRAAAVTVAAGR